jgi:hypothetical protein
LIAVSDSSQRQRRTSALDSSRGVSDGVVQSFAQTVSLLIAVQVFGMTDGLTALISAAPFLGNLASLFYSARFSTSRRSKAILAAWPCFGASAAFAIASGTQGAGSYALWVTSAVVLFQLRLTFLTAIYHENYAAGRRGALYSRALVLMTSSALGAAWVCGRVLERDLSDYRWLLLAAAACSAASGVSIAAIPTAPPAAPGATNPFRNLALLKTQPAFGYILLTWFIFGFANLWLNPLRVIYVAESERGLGMSPFQALLILGVAWEGGRLVSTPLWARLFDRINFITLRIVLNSLMGVGLVLFFASDDPVWIGLGSLLTGMCASGGGLTWNLWVTQLAPPRETHIYMSVHSFLTGVRGVIGPYVAFWAFQSLSLQQMSWVSAGLVLLSIVLLVFGMPLLRRHQIAHRESAPT